MKETKRLESLIRQKSSPLLPIRAELPSGWEALVPKKGGGRAAPETPGVRAFIFDLYGTLFVSGAGEIGAANEAPGRDPLAPDEWDEREKRAEDTALVSMKRYFQGAVTAFHEKAKAAGTMFPEIRVEEIWTGYKGPVPAGWGPVSSVRELALLYELALNPVYPMPGAGETIGGLVERACVLGIISNAQFFSPLLFGAFFGKSPRDMGFDPELLVWSFEEGEAKPSARLFEKAAARLAGRGIKPDETVYVGNDMKNDMVPAAAAGFRTALFAGDSRSLRLRDMTPRTKTNAGERAVPSFVIRDLQSLTEIR
ncbi:MAG: HAD family hydrolase [Treponema sp.]|nr:HAD family hydrolase [Treponema sp.]